MLVERRVAGRTLRAECAERHRLQAAAALAVFEGVPGLAPGIQIRFGWSLLRLIDDGDALRVVEPDFPAWPDEGWTPTIDITLDVLAAQIGMLQRLGVDGEDTTFDQALVAAPGALDRPGVFLRRDPGLSEDDSGWSLGALEDPEALARADRLDRVAIAALVARRRPLLEVLTLPRGFVAVVAGEKVEQVLDAAGRTLLP